MMRTTQIFNDQIVHDKINCLIFSDIFSKMRFAIYSGDCFIPEIVQLTMDKINIIRRTFYYGRAKGTEPQS